MCANIRGDIDNDTRETLFTPKHNKTSGVYITFEKKHTNSISYESIRLHDI